jgi:2-amino-4-hydroxy-6-hydroxymethyldihydropteridine diphosphokinase
MGERQFLIGLGSNIGNRADFISQAIKKIGQIPGVELLAISQAYDSDPVGYADQPNFLNLCIALVYKENAEALLRETAGIESALGRERTLKDGPRTIDIDLLFCEQEVFKSSSLTLPHPRWRERSFVVYPLRQILQSPALAKEARWNWLKEEVAQINISSEGLRIWNGPTPWNSTTT